MGFAFFKGCSREQSILIHRKDIGNRFPHMTRTLQIVHDNVLGDDSSQINSNVFNPCFFLHILIVGLFNHLSVNTLPGFNRKKSLRNIGT